LYIEFEADRFITRFNAIQKEVFSQAEKRRESIAIGVSVGEDEGVGELGEEGAQDYEEDHVEEEHVEEEHVEGEQSGEEYDEDDNAEEEHVGEDHSEETVDDEDHVGEAASEGIERQTKGNEVEKPGKKRVAEEETPEDTQSSRAVKKRQSSDVSQNQNGHIQADKNGEHIPVHAGSES